MIGSCEARQANAVYRRCAACCDFCASNAFETVSLCPRAVVVVHILWSRTPVKKKVQLQASLMLLDY
jgi:hypothetical protein